MYTATGNQEVGPGFTLVNVNNAVEGYAQLATKMSESRWEKLQALCNFTVTKKITMDDEVFEISGARHLMYDASSPPPE